MPKTLARVVATLLLLASPLSAAPAPLPTVSADVQTVLDGRAMPSGIVTALAEDREGLIWVGTLNGLLRFDGYRLAVAGARPGGLPRVQVLALLPARDGRLWVGLQGEGLWVRDPASGEFTRAETATSPRPIGLALAEDHDGAIWVGDARDGVRRLRPEGGFDADRHLLPGVTVRSLRVDRAGDLWIGHRDGLARKAAGSTTVEPVTGLEGRYVYSLYEAADGRLWVGTQTEGAFVVDPATRLVHALPAVGAADGVGHPWVDGFAEPSPGEIWLSTFGGGIEARDPDTHRLLRRVRAVPGRVGSLAVDRVQSLLRDRAGHLWIATWGGGLQRLPPGARALERLNVGPEGLRHPTITSSLVLPDGRLWLGSGAFGIDEVDLATMRVRRSFPLSADSPSDTVRSLLRTQEGAIWAAAQEGGLWRADAPDARFLAVSSGWAEQRVRIMAPASVGGLWVGLERGVRRVQSGGASDAPLTRADGSPFEELVWALEEDANGTLWVGTPIGLWMKPAGAPHLLPFGLAADVPSDAARVAERSGVLVLRRARDGTLWMLARDGLYSMATPGPEGRFVSRVDALSLPQGLGEQLIEDASGVIWTGRARFDPASEHVQALGPADGLDVGNQVWNASNLLPDGRLLLGSSNGLVLLDTLRFQPWRFEPRVVASGVELDGRPAPVTAAGLRVPPGPHRIAIEFAALDYSEPSALRYRYRLEGQDKDWTEVDASQRIAAYGNLWPGDYRLLVEGTNRAGQWSPHRLDLPIVVEAAFWQTPIFMVSAVVALFLALYAFLHWRAGRTDRRSRELEQLVEQRTAELVEAHAATQKTLSELRGAQHQLVEAEKMASLGQMVAGVAHELNTPLGNALVVGSTLKERAEEIAGAIGDGALRRSQLEEFLAALRDGSDLVVRNLKRAHELVSSFKQVAVDRSSNLRRRFDLRAVVDEALAMHQGALRHHPCTIECRVPDGIEMDSYPGAINQIVGNMVGNAVMHAFGEEGAGRLVITARVQEAGQGREVLLEFVDDGVGMDEATQRRAFDPFFTTRMGRGGTGLGLNIVYNLVSQLLGGSIGIESAPGAGTRFTLVLPASAPMAPPADDEPGI